MDFLLLLDCFLLCVNKSLFLLLNTTCVKLYHYVQVLFSLKVEASYCHDRRRLTLPLFLKQRQLMLPWTSLVGLVWFLCIICHMGKFKSLPPPPTCQIELLLVSFPFSSLRDEGWSSEVVGPNGICISQLSPVLLGCFCHNPSQWTPPVLPSVSFVMVLVAKKELWCFSVP